MNKKLKLILISLVVITLLGFMGYNYVMHGGARDLTSEETAFTVTSEAISSEFTANTDEANKKYLEKPIAISGVITSVKGNEVIIDNIVICTLLKPDSTIKEDQKATVKGRFVGFDDLMGELKLDQCFIIKN